MKVTGHRSPVTGHRSQVKHHLLPVTSDPSPGIHIVSSRFSSALIIRSLT